MSVGNGACRLYAVIAPSAPCEEQRVPCKTNTAAAKCAVTNGQLSQRQEYPNVPTQIIQ